MQIIHRKLYFTIALVLVIASSWTTIHSRNQSEYFIMVAKVYRNQKCGSASFAGAIGYDFEKRSGSFKYSDVETELKERAARNNYVTKSEVIIEAARRQFGCVIMYEKEHSGWGCSTKQYAVGFGDSETAAENDAVRKMRNSYKEVSYQVLRNIDASMY